MSGLGGLGTELRHDEPSSRRPRRRRRGLPRLLGVLVVLVVLTALLGGIYAGGRTLLSSFADDTTAAQADFAGPGSGEVVVVIEPGDTAVAIGRELAAKGVVASSGAFASAAAANPETLTIQPGSYTLRRQMSAADAVDLLLDTDSRLLTRVTVPEGSTVDAIVDAAVEQAELPRAELEAALEAAPELGLPSYAENEPEGFLFPATYDVEPGTSSPELLQAMVTRFEQAAEEVDLEARAAEIGRTPYEVVIVASLIEREVRRAEDFPKVSRVIYNRLDRDMPLQLDSTVNYVLDEPKERLDNDDIAVDSDYNTYEAEGLPPTPIASPGVAALEAALQPDDGNYIYFILVNRDGTTLFTNDYDEFINAKNKAREEDVY